MQVCSSFSQSLSQNPQLQKSVSLPTFHEQVPHNQQQMQSIEEGYWRQCTKWILRLRKKINISKSSLYLGISYLVRLVKLGFVLNEDNH